MFILIYKWNLSISITNLFIVLFQTNIYAKQVDMINIDLGLDSEFFEPGPDKVNPGILIQNLTHVCGNF